MKDLHPNTIIWKNHNLYEYGRVITCVLDGDRITLVYCLCDESHVVFFKDSVFKLEEESILEIYQNDNIIQFPSAPIQIMMGHSDVVECEQDPPSLFKSSSPYQTYRPPIIREHIHHVLNVLTITFKMRNNITVNPQREW